jgi:hypothetical protein
MKFAREFNSHLQNEGEFDLLHIVSYEYIMDICLHVCCEHADKWQGIPNTGSTRLCPITS